MKHAIFILVLLLSLPAAATNYYFSTLSGASDSNNGLTPSTPKLTLAAIKTRVANLSPGDSVLFARGSNWYDVGINITADGTSGNRIVFAAYGTGARPNFYGVISMTGFSQNGNIWSKTDSRIKGTKENWVDFWNGSWQDYDRRTGFIPAIWINGGVGYLSRYPNSTPMSFSNVDNSGYTYANGASSSLPGSDALSGAQLKIMQGQWSRVFTTITGNSTTDIDITASDFDPQFGELDDGAKGMIMNSTNATVMDQNGEFAINNSTQTIYIYYTGNLNTQLVHIPVSDSVFCLTGANYVTIRDLEIFGSRGMGIKVRGCTGAQIIGCKIMYCTLNGIHETGNVNFYAAYNDVSYCDNGIGGNYPTASSIQYNYIHKIGLDPAFGDKEGASGNGIYYANVQTATNFNYNYFDSIDYNPIHVHANLSDASPQLIAYGNYTSRWCMMRTDAGATYFVSANDNVGSLVRRNFYINAADKSAWIFDDNHTEGGYLDNEQSYTTFDSNTVVNSPSLLFINYGGDYNTIRGNKGITFNAPAYSNSALYVESLGSVDHLTLTGNEFVVTDVGSMHIRWNGGNGESSWNCDGCSFTNNKYFNYYSGGATMFQKIEYWGTQHNFSTIAQWQTYTGLESGSTQKFLSTLSADAAVMYVNYSSSSKTFNLGTNSFRDYDNNTVSGSLTLPRYSSRILYHVSGSGGDSPMYVVNPVTSYVSTGGGGSGGTTDPGTGQVILYDDGIEQIPYDEGILQIFE